MTAESALTLSRIAITVGGVCAAVAIWLELFAATATRRAWATPAILLALVAAVLGIAYGNMAKKYAAERQPPPGA
jgi:hypothetical protein